jgi:TolB protein
VLDVTLARMELAVALARAGLTGRIAFSGIVSGKRDIYIMDAAGGNRTPLTTAGAGCFRPALSPDGSQVLYAYETGGIRRIFVMNSDGSQVTAITAGPSDDYPAWSPDGRRIAFQSVRYGSNHIIVASSNGTGEVDLGPGRFPTWSPEGDKVAFVTSGQIHICPAAGGGAVPIGPDTGAYYPAWSPDGLCITLSLKEGTDAYGLYVLTIATGDLRRLAGGRSHLRSAFSPDGSMVAYHTVGTESAATQIYIVAAAGGVPLWVSRSGGECHDPSCR